MAHDAPAKHGNCNGVCCVQVFVDRQICRLPIGRVIALLLGRAGPVGKWFAIEITLHIGDGISSDGRQRSGDATQHRLDGNPTTSKAHTRGTWLTTAYDMTTSNAEDYTGHHRSLLSMSHWRSHLVHPPRHHPASATAFTASRIAELWDLCLRAKQTNSVYMYSRAYLGFWFRRQHLDRRPSRIL